MSNKSWHIIGCINLSTPDKRVYEMLCIGIVVVHYRHEALTSRCLQSLLQHTSATLYVVDNGSGDNSLVQLRRQFSDPRIQWVALSENRGYGAGANAGMALAWEQGVDAVLLLNNDTWVEHNVVQILAEHSQQFQHQALLTGTIYLPDGTIWYSGGRISFPTVKSCHRNHLSSLGFVHFISGCMVWIPRRVFERLGEFDESFFMYWEDGDLSLRAKVLGIPLIYVPSAGIYHQGSATVKGEDTMALYYQNRNRWHMIRRYGTKRQRWGFMIWSGLGMGRRCLVALKMMDWHACRVNYESWCDGFLTFSGRIKQTGRRFPFRSL